MIDQKARIGVNIAIIASFVVIAFFSVYFLIRQNVINGAWDLPFHWERMYERVNSYRHHVFLPYYNVTEMGGNGTSVMLLYPYITLLQFVII
ncbi:hypothetical protein ACYATO_03035 [Lactobacillaceae bacterium Melli_B3]